MKKTVIIVDDSAFMVNMLQDFFQDQLGYDVLGTGSNGIHAVELYRKHKPDLITLDLTMPIRDGYAALKEIMNEFPQARVLIITSLIGPAVLECIKVGARAYIEKPLRLKEDEFCNEFRQTLDEAFRERASK